jgi:hypothetical protein
MTRTVMARTSTMMAFAMLALAMLASSGCSSLSATSPASTEAARVETTAEVAAAAPTVASATVLSHPNNAVPPASASPSLASPSNLGSNLPVSPPPVPPDTISIAVAQAPRNIRVHYPWQGDPLKDCAAVFWVVRTVPAGTPPVDYAVRVLLAGPTAFEESQGLFSPFAHSTSVPTASPLAPSALTVSIHQGVATVDFAPSAEPYFHQAVCAASALMTAIVSTLLQFQEIDEVQFSSGGVVITEWDA